LRVRLPTVGDTTDDPFGPAPMVGESGSIGDPGRPLLCVAGVVDTSSMLALACDLVRALGSVGHPAAALRVQRRTPAGMASQADPAFDVQVGDAGGAGRPLLEAGASPVVVVRTDPAHAAQALEQGLPRLGAGEGPVVCVGNDVPALWHAALTVLITGGMPPSSWAPSARALRERIDIELTDVRPGFAKALAHAWTGAP
jgi:hypothetical protein